MAAYTNINPSTQLVPGRPGTSALFQALEENPRAIAAGASGAPEVEVAWHLLEAQTLGATSDEFELTTDISAYRAIRLVGGAKSSSTGNALFKVDVLIASTWRNAFTGAGSQSAIVLDVTIDRTDADDFKTVTAIVGESDGLADYNQRTGALYMKIIENTGPATAIRLTSGSAIMATTTELNLYGIKRTAA